MSVDVHFLNVDQGNMTVVVFPDDYVIVYDCNITEYNEANVFSYLKKIMPKNEIDIFVNSHRDADHMRGIKKLNDTHKINMLFDSGVSGNTEAPEYQDYMNFRRNHNFAFEVRPNQHLVMKPFVTILNGKREHLEDINAQSIVMRINCNGASVLLTGDTDVNVWKDYIMHESASELKSSILLASHHGALSFFKDTEDAESYEDHLMKIKPDVTIISVGKDNPHGHPDKNAVELYEKHTNGANSGKKILRTDIDGNIKLELKDNGSWEIKTKQ